MKSMIVRPSAPVFKRAHLILLSAFLTVGFLTVSARLIYIQGFQNGEWLKRAERAHEKNISIEAERGTIYDRNGSVLAMNVEVPSVYAIPGAVSDPIGTARLLSRILEIDRRLLAEKLREGKNFVWLSRKIDPAKAKEIEKHQIGGIGFIMESQRFYPKRTLFGHSLGFAGLDNRGLEGVELKYDSHLRGGKGWLVVERDAHGKAVFPKGFEYVAPARGKDLHLTIDETIQYISERELDRVVERSGAKGGTVIVMDPWSGEILAMAVRPQFNPNRAGVHDPSEWRNRAVTDLFEPGSTFKIVTASAALEEKVVQPRELIDCEEGAYPVMGTVIHDHDPLGVVPFGQVIAKSSNVGTVKVAERLGKERMAAYIRAFGFGEKVGMDFIGEAPGLVRSVAQWSKRSLASVAIGQEVGVTPLQVATAASVIANGGWLMAPHLIRQVSDSRSLISEEPDFLIVRKGRDPKGGDSKGARGLRRTAPQARRRVVSEETAWEMTRILEGVVSKSGTGERAVIPGYSVAGKTGTAQKIDPETGHYSASRFVSSFVGFAPADDPAVTILVMVDEPQGISWGGTVAAPVFASIGREVLRHLKVPQTPAVRETTQTASLNDRAGKAFFPSVQAARAPVDAAPIPLGRKSRR